MKKYVWEFHQYNFAWILHGIQRYKRIDRDAPTPLQKFQVSSVKGWRKNN